MLKRSGKSPTEVTCVGSEKDQTMSLLFGSEVGMCVPFSVVMNLCLCVSADVSGEGPDVSSPPAGV